MVKHYTKEEIEAVKHEITPLDRIRKDHFGKQTYIDEDRVKTSKGIRRHENVNKLRG